MLENAFLVLLFASSLLVPGASCLIRVLGRKHGRKSNNNSESSDPTRASQRLGGVRHSCECCICGHRVTLVEKKLPRQNHVNRDSTPKRMLAQVHSTVGLIGCLDLLQNVSV